MNKQWIGTLLLGILTLPGLALAQPWVAGEHYEVLEPAVQQAQDERVEVVEVFSYGCVHCFSFDPLIEGWKAAAPDDVQFERLPAVFNQDWAILAQVFYTAQVLGVLDKVHTPVFNGIHVQGIDVRDPRLAAELFEREAGVTPEQYAEVANSFSIRSRVQQAVARTRAYRINAVPTMVVAGKYRITGSTAGSNQKMLELVDYLVEQERAAKLGDQLAADAAAAEGE